MSRAALALLLVACGGSTPPAATHTAPEPQSPVQNRASCPFGPEDIASAPLRRLPGLRISVAVPDSFVHLVGVPALAHECGVVITFAETPPMDSREERGVYLEGVTQGFLDSAGSCRDLGPNTWSCGDTLARIVDDGEVMGLVTVRGPLAVARAISSRISTAPDAPWDPSRAMRLGVAPVAQLPLHDLASPTALIYGTLDEGTQPALRWSYHFYNQGDRDGAPWSDREVAEWVGHTLASQLGVAGIDESSLEEAVLRESALGNDLQLTGRGRSAEGPVRFYCAFFRENVGFFVVVARAPEASGDAWMRRFSEHARSYRVLD